MGLADQIIQQLYFFKCLSVSELSVLTRKSIPKITEQVAELVRQDILVEKGFAASTGGRRAMLYALCVRELPLVVTIAIDQFFTTVAAVDLKNSYVVPPQVTPIRIHEDERAFDRLVEAIGKLSGQLRGRRPFVVGVTMPGFVNSEEGINLSFPVDSPFYDIKRRLEEILGCPVQLANDSSAIAVAEHKFGVGRGSADVLVVNLNWGVGLGMIIENNLYKGFSGYAGEFSHIPLADAQQLCSCGKKGCLEVEASLSCVLADVQEFLRNGEPSSLQGVSAAQNCLELRDIVRAFDSGDQVAIKAVRRIAHMLGKGLSTLIHIMNPERIIISGNGAAFGKGLLPTIQSAVQEYSIPRLAKYTEILISDIPDIQTISTASIAVQQTNMYQFQNKQIKLQL